MNVKKLEPVWGSGADLGDWLGITNQAIAQMKKAGHIVPNEDGLYDLRAEVRAYIKRMRTPNKTAEKQEIELETARWKLENVKLKNREWRMQRDRETVLAVVQSMQSVLADFRRGVDEGKNPIELLDEISNAVRTIDYDSIVITVEGESVGDDYGKGGEDDD